MASSHELPPRVFRLAEGCCWGRRSVFWGGGELEEWRHSVRRRRSTSEDNLRLKSGEVCFIENFFFFFLKFEVDCDRPLMGKQPMALGKAFRI